MVPYYDFRSCKKDFQNIERLIKQAITDVWLAEGVRQDVIEAYFKQAGDIRFAKTASRKMTSRMTQLHHDSAVFSDHLNKSKKAQVNISMLTARFLQLVGKNDAIYPQEKTLELLKPFTLEEKNVIEVKMYQFLVQLKVGSHDIWRRITIPETFTFKQFHFALQTVF